MQGSVCLEDPSSRRSDLIIIDIFNSRFSSGFRQFDNRSNKDGCCTLITEQVSAHVFVCINYILVNCTFQYFDICYVFSSQLVDGCLIIDVTKADVDFD